MGSERGASAIEFVMLTPLLVLVLFAVVQFGMYFFARQVATSAAQAGARTARAEADSNAGWSADAVARAQQQISGLGSRMVVDPSVTAIRDGESVGVEVVARSPKLLPFIPTIDVRSEGPIERFVPDTGG
nr:TadE/TadG family type IV pilus assembly protein [Mangrovactinospora gilvigrisea]